MNVDKFIKTIFGKRKQTIKQLMYYLEDNMLIEKIIFYTITEEEIKNYICEQMMKLIEKHLEKDWDWKYLSMNRNATPQDRCFKKASILWHYA